MEIFFRNELRLLLRDRTVLVLCVLTALLFGLGAANGARFAEQRRVEIERLIAKADGDTAADRAKVAAGEASGAPWDNAADPYRRRAMATLPPAALAGMAVGMSDLHGYWAEVTSYSLPSRLFRSHELGNPLNRLLGSFDLGFVLVFLFPLLLLALTYDLLSGDRERGILALTIAQGASLRTLLAGKLMARGVLGVGLALAVSVLTLLAVAGGSPGAWIGIGLWAALVLVYGIFWLALAWLVATRGASSNANALALGGIWLALVVVAPAILHLVASAIHPLPSRHALIVSEREAETAGLREQAKLLEKFALDHPELIPDDQPVDWTDWKKSYYASRLDLEQRLAPISGAFEENLAAQQGMVARYRFLSPAVVAHEAVLDLAGSGHRRYRAFIAQVREFLDTWRTLMVPKIFRNEPMATRDFDQLPAFRFQEEPAAQSIGRLGRATLGIAIPALVLFWLGWRRLSQISVVG